MGRASSCNGRVYFSENNPNYDRSLAAYMRDISKTEPLSSEEEIELGKRIKTGDLEARNELVEANLRFVVSVSNEYWNINRSRSDLIAAGNVGLITAAERFDEARGVRFISYAVWWIRQAMLQYLAMNERTVRLPLNRIEIISKFNRFDEDYLRKNEETPTAADIADEFEISVSEASSILKERLYSLSLDNVVGEDERSAYELLQDKNQKQPDEVVDENRLENLIKKYVDGLDEREAEVLKYYFGLDGYPEMTLQKIGEKIGLTRERVRQIKEKAIRKLNHPKRNQVLREYWSEKIDD